MGAIESPSVSVGATRFDPRAADHHHVPCADCGEIGDVHVAGTGSLSIDGTRAFLSMLFRGTRRFGTP